ASIGHTNCSYHTALRGIEAGINHATHLFNAMPPLHHREPGPLLAILETNHITTQVISDGVHIHPQILKFASRILDKDRIVIITDGMQAMGLPEGPYSYNGLEYISEGGAASYADGTLIGTTLGMSELIDRFCRFTGYSYPDALKTATLNPARLLGVENKKGFLAPGAHADIVLLNPDKTVWKTIVGGEIVYSS
ncbi:MAG: amidohydrolase family protein, partial [Spirochaetota bacterium]